MGGDAVIRSAMAGLVASGKAVAMPTVEQFAKEKGRLHPDVHATLRNWFPSKVLSAVRVEVRPRDWARFHQSGRGSATPAFTSFGTLYAAEGFLNRPGWLWGNTCDLGENNGLGWETLIHEVRHIQQYLDDGWIKTAAAFVGGVIRSLWANVPGKRTWNHDVIPMEQDAIAFAKKVKGELIQRATPPFWRKFQEIG